jgi:hypothetical protein
MPKKQIVSQSINTTPDSFSNYKFSRLPPRPGPQSATANVRRGVTRSTSIEAIRQANPLAMNAIR